MVTIKIEVYVKKEYKGFKYWKNRTEQWVIEYPSKTQGVTNANNEQELLTVIDGLVERFQ